MNEILGRLHLHRIYPWKVALASWVNEVLVVHGWALMPNGNSDLFTITANEFTPNIITKGLPTPNLYKSYPYWPNARNAGFKASFYGIPKESDVVLQLSNALSLESFNDMSTIYIPSSSGPSEVPSPDQLRRTQGDVNEYFYEIYGFTMAKKISEIVRRHCLGDEFLGLTVLDWGCGCGRISRWLPNIFLGGRLLAADIDAHNIQWCKENIDGVDFEVFPLLPPTRYSSNSLNVVFGVSVVTHLSHEAQELWAKELGRIIMSGGLLLLTYNGPDIWARIASSKEIANIQKHGIDDVTHDHNLGNHIDDPNYYRLTFQNKMTFSKIFKDFSFIQEYPGFNISGQDLVVLRRK